MLLPDTWQFDVVTWAVTPRLVQELLSGHTAPRDVLWTHLKQGRAVMMEQLVQAAIQRASLNLNKQEDKTAPQWQGWGWVEVFFQVRATLNGFCTNLIILAATAHFR